MASFVYVPVACARKLKEVATETVQGNRRRRTQGAARSVVFMDWLKVKESTANFLNLPKTFKGDENDFSAFNSAVEGSAPDTIKFAKIEDHQFRIFTGIDDQSGESRQRSGSERVGGIIRVAKRTIGVRVPTVRTLQATGTTARGYRSINIAFPDYFTRLMIRQCLGHLCSFRPGLTRGYYIVENVKYAMVKKAWSGPVNGAESGAWYVQAIPSGLTPDNPDIPGDTGTPVSGGGNLAT